MVQNWQKKMAQNNFFLKYRWSKMVQNGQKNVKIVQNWENRKNRKSRKNMKNWKNKKSRKSRKSRKRYNYHQIAPNGSKWL